MKNRVGIWLTMCLLLGTSFALALEPRRVPLQPATLPSLQIELGYEDEGDRFEPLPGKPIHPEVMAEEAPPERWARLDGLRSGAELDEPLPESRPDWLNEDAPPDEDWGTSENCGSALEPPVGWTRWSDSRLAGGYLFDSGSDGLSWASASVQGSLKFPRAPFIWLTPSFAAYSLGGSGVPDIPSQLYTTSLSVTAAAPLSKKLFVQLGVSPSLYTDFNNNGGDAFRLPSRLLGFYQWSERLTLVGGVMYPDREDISLIPAAGLIYKPRADTTYELMFPRPKISKLIRDDGSRQLWLYIAGEIGGGTWAIEHAAGTEDLFTYQDLRLLLGVDRKLSDTLGWTAEAGYVFGRKVEFESGRGDRNLDGAAIVQGSLRF